MTVVARMVSVTAADRSNRRVRLRDVAELPEKNALHEQRDGHEPPIAIEEIPVRAHRAHRQLNARDFIASMMGNFRRAIIRLAQHAADRVQDRVNNSQHRSDAQKESSSCRCSP